MHGNFKNVGLIIIVPNLIFRYPTIKWIDYTKLELDKKTAIIHEIELSAIKILLDNPIEYVNLPIDLIELSKRQLKNIEIISDENKELQLKNEDDKLVKYKSTSSFSSILKAIKFKRKYDYLDFSFLDICSDKNKNDEDYVSYIPASKCKEVNLEKYRQKSRIGRILKKLNDNYTDVEIENFVDKFKSEQEFFLGDGNVEVVTGDLISYWYSGYRYKQGDGTLNKSCLKYDNRVKFYDKYPDRIALAIIVKNNELCARALLWKLDDGKVYMDRIYSINGKYKRLIEKYGKDNKMLMYPFISQDPTITLKIDGHEDLPWMDTFWIERYKDSKKLLLYR